MEIIYLEQSQNDLVWFRHYYTFVFPEGATSALSQFDKTEAMLLANPFIGIERRKGVRKLTIAKTPFAYIYRVTKNHIEIMRVYDTRQK